jgi:hypothetical protein
MLRGWNCRDQWSAVRLYSVVARSLHGTNRDLSSEPRCTKIMYWMMVMCDTPKDCDLLSCSSKVAVMLLQPLCRKPILNPNLYQLGEIGIG